MSRSLLVILSCWIALPSTTHPAAVGPVAITVEHGLPVLCWSNSPGGVFVVEKATNLTLAGWQKQVTVTSDATNVAWADDVLPQQTAFYRVAVSTNPTVFQNLQQALRRACVNQGIVGASAAAVLPKDGIWIGTFGRSHGVVPIRPHTPFEVGSVTKTFVAATVLRLAEEGRLSLDDAVGRWLPNLNNPHIAASITIKAGTNLPGELLIALSALAENESGTSGGAAPNGQLSTRLSQFRIPFLDAEIERGE